MLEDMNEHCGVKVSEYYIPSILGHTRGHRIQAKAGYTDTVPTLTTCPYFSYKHVVHTLKILATSIMYMFILCMNVTCDLFT